MIVLKLTDLFSVKWLNHAFVCILQTPIDTERSAAGFIKFLKSHATIPFEAPDVPEPEPEPENELEGEDEDHTEEEGVESIEAEEGEESIEAEEEAEQFEEEEVKDEL